MMAIVLLMHIDCIICFLEPLESPWKWENGSVFETPFPWKRGEPGRYTGADQRCLRLDGRGYHAEKCSKNAHYICELGLYTSHISRINMIVNTWMYICSCVV